MLPLECFTPGVGNTCGTGSFGVADPATLDFRYYVKLDPAEIPPTVNRLKSSPSVLLVVCASAPANGQEVAETLEVTERTVQRLWLKARLMLQAAME